MQSSPRPRRIEVPQAVPFRNCASMNPRCGSHAEIVAGERASIGVGRQGVGICPAEPADTPGDLRPQQRNASGIRGSSCNRYPWRARSPVGSLRRPTRSKWSSANAASRHSLRHPLSAEEAESSVLPAGDTGRCRSRLHPHSAMARAGNLSVDRWNARDFPASS